MRKLNFILLYLWSALAFAVGRKAQVNKPYGEWFKLGVRVVQQQQCRSISATSCWRSIRTAAGCMRPPQWWREVIAGAGVLRALT